MISLTDTHCHLYFNHFNKDINAVRDRAWDEGLCRILIPGIDLETSRKAVQISQSDPRLFAAVGFHPHDASSWNEGSREEIRRLAQNPKVVAIGEIGLDYYRDRSPRPQQRKVFLELLDLASELAMPVVIHNREATSDMFSIISDWAEHCHNLDPSSKKTLGVMHSFSGTKDIANQAIESGFFLGISGPVTYDDAKRLHFLVSSLPLDRLLLETDAPFLTPEPYRGQRNEPSYIPLIAEKIARLKITDIKDIAKITTTNANQLFAWGAQS